MELKGEDPLLARVNSATTPAFRAESAAAEAAYAADVGMVLNMYQRGPLEVLGCARQRQCEVSEKVVCCCTGHLTEENTRLSDTIFYLNNSTMN